VYRSRFLPRFLGVWQIINGLAYLANGSTGLLLPLYQNAVGNFTFPALTGEVSFVMWLLIRGAKEQTVNARHLISAHNELEREPHYVFRLYLMRLSYHPTFVTHCISARCFWVCAMPLEVTEGTFQT
jgi:hypothetical protein